MNNMRLPKINILIFVIPVSIVLLLSVLYIVNLSKIKSKAVLSNTSAEQNAIALVHGRLIDGNGSNPVNDSIIIIKQGKIESVGSYTDIKIPKNSTKIDLKGLTVLPGFINAHVHSAYSAKNLTAWLKAGVTTVRDEGIIDGYRWKEILSTRQSFDKPEYARIISACPMLGPEGGYCNLPVGSAEEAKRLVNEFIDSGINIIKISKEDGIAGRTDMPMFTDDMYKTIITTAHQRHIPISAHVTDGKYLQDMIDAGVDDIAHVQYDYVLDDALKEMKSKNIYLVPTLSVYRQYGGLSLAISNLSLYVKAGVKIAMGNDYADQVAEYGYELGMPIFELECMEKAGMTSIQIIEACTKNAAHVCNREKDLGTVEKGKIADLLIVEGDPLSDIHKLLNVKLVIKDGKIANDVREKSNK